jgi:NADPH-dependent 2,4-dienoyl-CoA reductase/sulfur reductase-like enzyme
VTTLLPTRAPAGYTAPVHHVIVGNSVAGIEAAIALRNRDAAARITVISAEHPHFFARTALMYVYCGQLSLADTEPYDRGLYERLRLDRVHDRVTAVDPARRSLTLANTPPIAYDTLLLAVGSVGRTLPGAPPDGPGLHRFVTLGDLEKLDRETKPGQSAAVIGGGLIGVEAAEILLHRGLSVRFLVREPWYFPMALDPREAAIVADHLRRHGLDVRLGAAVSAVTGPAPGGGGGVAGGSPPAPGPWTLETGEGPLVVDHVVAAIGVRPATDFLRGAVPLGESGAIVVDDALRTNIPGIWAAGDCAEVTWIDGRRAPEQLWYTARDQGRVAARSMLGDEVSYRRSTWYNSAKFFDVEYTTAGWIPPGDPPTPPGYRTWFQHAGGCVTQRVVCKGERVVGFNGLGSRWNHEVFLRWIHERRPLPYVLEHMREATFDEELSPPFRVLPTATVTEG